MFKFILSFFIAMFSINAFADGYTCTVPNTGGVEVKLLDTSSNSDSNGVISAISVRASSKGIGRSISVVVVIYDALTNKSVKAETITIENGKEDGYTRVSGLAPNRAYYFKIHRATCE